MKCPAQSSQKRVNTTARVQKKNYVCRLLVHYKMVPFEQNEDTTVFINNLDERCTKTLIWELMLQAGPVVNVRFPKVHTTERHLGYCFCEFLTMEDANYAVAVMNRLRLYNKVIHVRKIEPRKTSIDKGRSCELADVGATLYVGNLDCNVDEKMLYDVFSAYGNILHTPKVARDPDTGAPCGYALISFSNFDAADQAIDAMNDRHLMSKPIEVTYSFLRKTGRKRERR
ncbi:hypothetical protein BX666DRAFT_1964031 [Dichotomocladium elegans]|nr:hypothetical protein BX666DRAFT_1964031 [Dichotomocladium elegans]